ncbi:hypothetical protein FACS1894113_4750 [Alphaproteobacteria bacterium]|nr:hypothetical protein FACS1894113_4750 [Alphaproteobacteria bacterium]
MNTIIEKQEFRTLDMAVLKWHFRLESNLENEYLSRIIDVATEDFENETEKFILKKSIDMFVLIILRRYICQRK